MSVTPVWQVRRSPPACWVNVSPASLAKSGPVPRRVWRAMLPRLVVWVISVCRACSASRPPVWVQQASLPYRAIHCPAWMGAARPLAERSWLQAAFQSEVMSSPGELARRVDSDRAVFRWLAVLAAPICWQAIRPR